MALSLDDIIAAPSDPDLLNQHLQGLGLLKRPEEVAATQVAPMTPVAPPPSSVAPMTPPASFPVEAGHPRELTGLDRELSIGATAQPNKPTPHMADLGTSPEISAAAPSAEGAIPMVKPMTLPNLTHTEKMALPETSAGVSDVGSSQYTRNELERLEEQKAHPWGTAENHPGLLGKIGHVAGKIGNIALDVAAPSLALNIPGTDLNRLGQESELKKELAKRTAAEGQAANLKSEEEARNVQTEEGKERLKKLQTEQSLEKDAEGNITGWKGPDGALHSLDEEGTPQAIKDIATATQSKPHFEKTENGDIVQITPGKNGAPAQSDVVYKGNAKQKTEIRSIVDPASGHAHDQVIDVTPGSPTFGKSLADLGRSKEDKAPSVTQELTKLKADEEPVIGYDKDGVMQLVPRGQAKEAGLQHIIKATPKDREDAQQNTSVLNDMGKKVKDVFDSRKALDQNWYQKTIIANALSHPGGGTIDSLVRAGVLTGATDLTKDYVQSVLSLRESSLALPKQLTGGSRVSEIQAQALWATAPGVQGDSKYAEKQLRKFDDNLGRLWKKVPRVEGNAPERAFPGEGAGGAKGGATATPPAPPPGKVVVLDQKKEPHFVNENQVDEFLKDPKYKGWTRGTGR